MVRLRGNKAKRIRRDTYGHLSIQLKHYARLQSGQVVCVGTRAKYLKAKEGK